MFKYKELLDNIESDIRVIVYEVNEKI